MRVHWFRDSVGSPLGALLVSTIVWVDFNDFQLWSRLNSLSNGIPFSRVVV